MNKKNTTTIPEVMHYAVDESKFWDVVEHGLQNTNGAYLILHKSVEEAKLAAEGKGEKFVFSVLTGAASRNGTKFVVGENGTLLTKKISSVYLVKAC